MLFEAIQQHGHKATTVYSKFRGHTDSTVILFIFVIFLFTSEWLNTLCRYDDQCVTALNSANSAIEQYRNAHETIWLSIHIGFTVAKLFYLFGSFRHQYYTTRPIYVLCFNVVVKK